MPGLKNIYLSNRSQVISNLFTWDNILFLFLFFFQFFIYLSGGHETESQIPRWVSLPIELAFLVYVTYLSFTRKFRFSRMVYYILVLTIMAALIGFVNGGSIAINLLTSYMILAGCIMTQIPEEKIFRFIFLISLVGIFFVLKEFYYYDPSQAAEVLMERGLIHDIPLFQSISILWMFTLLIMISFVYKKQFLLAGVVWALNMVVNLMATKRLFVVQTAWILAVLMLFFTVTKQRKEMKVLVILIPIVLLLGIAAFSYFDLDYQVFIESLEERSNADNIESSGFARFRESENYFNSASIIDIIMGKGLGVIHHGLGEDNTDLHIGITNLILKYGIWMFPLFISLVIRSLVSVLKMRNYYRDDPWRVVCILVSIVNIPMFCTVANFYTLNPNTAFFWYCLIRSTYSPKKNAIPVSRKI